MIVQESFLKKLRSSFDLNIYEVKIWVALLSRGVASAGELADISSVPRSRSYDVLESLEKKGFVLMKLGKPIKYLAVKPEEVIKRVKTHVKETATERLSDLEGIRSTDIYGEIELLFNQGIDKIDPTELSGVLKGRKAIIDHIKSMISNAQSSVTMVTTSQGFARKTDVLKNTLKKANERGIKIRIAAPIDPKKLPPEVKKLADIRRLSGQKARFIIADGNQMLFMVSNDEDVHESYDLGIWVNAPFFAKAMDDMFGVSWSKLK
ncbi:MAG: helix-turn-helix domain-containing protein [Candidatus Woesearchaeota archaeon]